jgi:hypothetical protein
MALSSPMPSPRRFAPPWSVEEMTESIVIRDATGQALSDVYFENEPQRQMSVMPLTIFRRFRFSCRPH